MSPRFLSGAARLAGSSLLRLQTDERLVALARTGHGPAFAAIVDRYRDELLRYAGRLVGPSRAEDVLQQALLNAHLAMSSNDENLNLRPWLYRITHNVAVNVLRAARSEAVLDERALAHREVHEDLETRERLRAALAAIAGLPQPQRGALTLQAIEGRSHEEVAAAMGLTPGAARQHVHRARTSLRAAVSAITPYGLLLRFPAEATLGAGASAAAGGATAKIAAAVLAAGAVAGGATQLPTSSDRAADPTPAAAAATPPRTAPPSGPSGRAIAPASSDDDTEVAEDHRRRHGRNRGESEDERGDDRSGTDGSDEDHSGRGDGDDGSHSGESNSDPDDGTDDLVSDDSGSSLSSGPGSGESRPLEVDEDRLSTTSGISGSSDSSDSGSSDSGSSGSGSSDSGDD